MNLPWIQLSRDGRRRAKMAGVLMGIGPHAGVGFVSDIWDAALELMPDGDFSGRVVDPGVLVAGAGGIPPGCTADAGGVVSILQRVGLLATAPELRVRGLDRYASTWRKNRKPRGHPPAPAAGAPRIPERKIEMKTDTSKTPVGKPTAPKESSRLKGLTELLVGDFEASRREKYKHGGAKDTIALKGLLLLADDHEIRRRWHKALDLGSTWPGCSTLAQLGSKWNDLGAPAGSAPRFDPDEGIVGRGQHQCADRDCPSCGPMLRDIDAGRV